MATIAATPGVLTWARDEVALSIDEAATRIGIAPERLRRWEQGEERPTTGKLRDLANLYKRPLAVFFLRQPPKTDRLPEDYRLRTVSGQPALPTRELLVAVRQAKAWQRTVAALADGSPDVIPELKVPSGRLTDQPAELGKECRQMLDVSDRAQLNWSTFDHALNTWRNRVEKLGVIVFAMPRLDRETCRGFSLFPPKGPPVITLASESPQARTFTLMHELGHLVLGQAAICNQFGGSSQHGRVEAFCNRLAASALMPNRLVTRSAKSVNPDDRTWTLALASDLAYDLKVSLPAACLRLSDLDLAPLSLFDAAMQRPAPEQTGSESKSSGGGANSWPGSRIAERGATFSHAVSSAWQQKLIATGDAAKLMNMKPKYVARIAASLESRRRRFG